MDPVTIAIITLVAIEGAKNATPYIIRWIGLRGKTLAANDRTYRRNTAYPVGGTGQILLMIYASGAGNIFQGLCAPFKLICDTLILPMAFCGIDTNFCKKSPSFDSFKCMENSFCTALSGKNKTIRIDCTIFQLNNCIKPAFYPLRRRSIDRNSPGSGERMSHIKRKYSKPKSVIAVVKIRNSSHQESMPCP